jgi:hypothetical protein
MPSALRAAGFAGTVFAVGLLAAPTAAAYPTGSCASSQIGTVVAETSAYTLCTSVGWVHVDQPVKLDPSGDCAHLGTVGPNGGTAYTVCTNLGWIDVNRPACTDFPAMFDCAGNPKF